MKRILQYMLLNYYCQKYKINKNHPYRTIGEHENTEGSKLAYKTHGEIINASQEKLTNELSCFLTNQ